MRGRGFKSTLKKVAIATGKAIHKLVKEKRLISKALAKGKHPAFKLASKGVHAIGYGVPAPSYRLRNRSQGKYRVTKGKGKKYYER